MKAQACTPEAIGTFYGMEVDERLIALTADENYNYDTKDLVNEHFRHHTLEKTLSGFYVFQLSGNNEHYYLYDLRDTRMIYMHHQDDLETFLALPDLDAFEKLLRAEAEDDFELSDYLDRAGIGTKASKLKPRKPSTPELCARYQWIWELCQYGGHLEPRYVAERSNGLFSEAFESTLEAGKAFKKELKTLPTDPHLAIYWILHTSLLGMEEEFRQVLDQVKDTPVPLVQAFAKRFGQLGLNGEMLRIPDFRERRALAAVIFFPEGQRNAQALKSLEMCPERCYLQRARHIEAALEVGELTEAQVRAALGRIPATTLVTEYLKATLDRRGGAPSSSHADAFMGLWTTCTDPLDELFDLFTRIKGLVCDPRSLVPIARHFYARQGRKPDVMALVEELLGLFPGDTAALEGLPDAGRVAEHRRTLDRLLPLHRAASSQEKVFVKSYAELGLDDQVFLAEWLLPQLEGGAVLKPKALQGLLGALVKADHPELHRLFVPGFEALDYEDQPRFFKHLRKAVRQDPALAPVLLRLVREECGTWVNFDSELNDDLIQYALFALSDQAHEEPLFTAILELLDEQKNCEPTEAILEALFAHSPDADELEANILPRLSAEQAIRLMQAQVRAILGHRDLGHTLYHFAHPGATEAIQAERASLEQKLADGCFDATTEVPYNLYNAHTEAYMAAEAIDSLEEAEDSCRKLGRR